MQDSLFFTIKLSLEVAMWSMVANFFLALPLAYWLLYPPKLYKKVIESFLLLPLLLPPTVMGWYLIVLLGREGLIGRYLFEGWGYSFLFTKTSAIVASMVVSFPLMLKAAQGAFAGVPTDFCRASYVFGYGPIETFLRVVLPLAKRGLIEGAILTFARGLGEFGATMMVAGYIPGKTNTLPLTLYALVATGEHEEALVVVFILTGCATCFLLLIKGMNRDRSLP